jgi:hypothetical protein
MTDDLELDDDGEPRTIPTPMTVAEILQGRQPNAPRPPEGYLSYWEVARAWPVVWLVRPVAAANGVRVNHVVTALTTGQITNDYYHAEDVQRVQDEIAAGTAKLETAWRRDTAEGRAAIREFKRRRARRQIIVAVVVGVLGVAGLMLLAVLLSNT